MKMPKMGRTLIVARYEFMVTVRRWGFLGTTLGMPLLLGLISILPTRNLHYLQDVLIEGEKGGAVGLLDGSGLLTDEALERAVLDLKPDSDGEEPESVEGVADTAKAVAGFMGHGLPFLRVSSLEELQQGVLEERFAAGWEVAEDWLETGTVSVHLRSPRGNFEQPFVPGAQELRYAIRLSMTAELPPERIQRVLYPAEQGPRVYVDRVDGEAGSGLDMRARVFRILLPLIFGLLFSMSIFLASGFLLDGISEEKESRVIEVLLAAVSPEELLNGKLIGLGAAGLLSLIVFLAAGLVPLVLLGVFELGVMSALALFAFFFLGYALYASLLAAVGAIAVSQAEGRQLSAVFTLTAVLPMLLLPRALAGEQDPLMNILSLFPLTSPVGMALRISQGGVPAIEIIGSLIGLVLTTILVMEGTVRIFRAATLMTGKRATVRQIAGFLKKPD